MTAGVRSEDTARLDALSPPADGTTTQFVLPYPYKVPSLGLYLNGLRLAANGGAYSATDGIHIMLTTAPLAGDTLEAVYEPAHS